MRSQPAMSNFSSRQIEHAYDDSYITRYTIVS
jgi:hypothetical protein